MGTITSTQPERIREIVPSKSKMATRAPAAETPGLICSIIVVREAVQAQYSHFPAATT